MDIKLKKRIVGILLLVAAGIILVPIVFNHSKNIDELQLSAHIPTPPAQPAQLQLPAIETPKPLAPAKPAAIPQQVSNANPQIVFEEIPVPNNQNNTPAAAPIATITPATPNVSNEKATAEIVPLKPATENNKVLQEVTASVEAPPQLEEEIMEPIAVTPAPVAKPVKTTQPHPNPTKIATVAAATKTTATASSSDTWVVQLGVFSDKLNADKLVKKLQTQGYKAYIRSIKTSSGKTITKVLVGPETQRVDAQKIQKELKNISPNAIVVKSGT